MTPAEIKKTRLYRALAPCVRKEDREELARMLAMVRVEHSVWLGMDGDALRRSFNWRTSPQGWGYWVTLSHRLFNAGHECW